jgi:hypothetical protein
MSRFDRLAVLISLTAVIICIWIGISVFENLPHIEDEISYVWEANLIAGGGEIKISSPPCPSCFFVPFVIDYQGERFSKYPLGWPVVLAFGIRLGGRNLVNPLLAGLCTWLIYRLGKKLMGEWVGIVAALLTLTSPFFLMNSSSLLSSTLSLFLTLVFSLAWLDIFWQKPEVENPPLLERKWYRRIPPGWLLAILAGLTLGLLALTRPLTAAAVGLPFFIHGLFLLIKGSKPIRQLVLLVGLVSLLVSSLYLLWQYSLTGDALRNPYTLWWDYDKIGYGKGIGVSPDGNSFSQVISNIYLHFKTGASDLFGWGLFSGIFLPFGLWATRKNRRAGLIFSVFPSLVLLYTLYWVASWLFGPRYYYEGIPSLILISAAGIAWLVGIPFSPEGIQKNSPSFHLEFPKFHHPNFKLPPKFIRATSVTALVALLISSSILFYDPARIGGLKGLYGVSRSAIDTFLVKNITAVTPVLVIVHRQSSWIDYGNLLELETPYLDSPFIFILDHGASVNQEAIDAYPERTVIDYYPGQ